MNSLKLLTNKELKYFHDFGFFIKKNFISLSTINQIQDKVSEHLSKRIIPFELEQEVNYPGSPKTIEELGGDTIRRLLLVYSRDKILKKWQLNPKVTRIIRQLLKAKELYLVQTHHNCIMTKQPQYSSETHWHKDTRYWSFKNNNLINTWLPLGKETVENGCLQVIPKSHLWNAPNRSLDERLFLRKDLKENQQWLNSAISVEMQVGDLLFFHAGLFHAAGSNKTQSSKNALVSTYHSEENQELVKVNKNLTSIKI